MTTERARIDTAIAEELTKEGSWELIRWANLEMSKIVFEVHAEFFHNPKENTAPVGKVSLEFKEAFDLIVHKLCGLGGTQTLDGLKGAQAWDDTLRCLESFAVLPKEERRLKIEALRVHLSLRDHIEH